MIKILTAYTAEIDDVDVAVTEILDQLDLDTRLLSNAVGIISCYSEFVESGVVEALNARLPFDTVGNTTIGTGTKGGLGQLLLTLSVLTSDDVRFAAGMSAPLTDTQEAPLADAYQAAKATLGGEEPKLMLGFMSLLQNVSGDILIDALDKVTGGVPVFGTVTVDHTNDYHTAQVLYNGKGYSDTFSFVLLAGDVHARFQVASISPEKIRKQQAIITAAQGSLLQEVNDMTALAYMQTLGLAKGGQVEGLNSIPFVIDYNDGTTPVVRAIFALTPEGYAVCGGVMPVGATLSVGSIDYGDVVGTTTAMVEGVLQDERPAEGLLMYSCISRFISLGVASDDEMDRVRGQLDGKLPYQFTYSGGELCPVYDGNGRLINRVHNDSIVACIL